MVAAKRTIRGGIDRKGKRISVSTFVCAALILGMMLSTGSAALAVVVKGTGSVDRDVLCSQI